MLNLIFIFMDQSFPMFYLFVNVDGKKCPFFLPLLILLHLELPALIMSLHAFVNEFFICPSLCIHTILAVSSAAFFELSFGGHGVNFISPPPLLYSYPLSTVVSYPLSSPTHCPLLSVQSLSVWRQKVILFSVVNLSASY